MGKTSKKSATKVEVAPAAAATKPLKKGKRDAEEVTEKQVPAKKQKQNKAALKQAIDKKKTEAKTQKKNKKDETSSEDDSSSESEEEVKVKPVAKKQVKKPVESSSEEDSSSDEEPKSKVSMKEVSAAAVAKNGSVAAKKKDETSDDSDSESEDESDEENETPAKVASKAAPAKVTNVPSKGKEDASESESDDESDSDEKPKVAGAKKDGSSEEDSSEEETSESEEEDKVPKTPKNKGGDVEMADADSKKSNIKDALKTHSTPQVQSTGSKTLFMGNLSFSIEREDVENFFKDAGEIADVRFGSDSEGIFKGYGHVEFVTVEAAQKALKLNGQDLLGRQVKLDLARERGERGPASGNENSYQKGGRGQAQAQGQTIFVKGFDTSGGEEQVRSALEEHFGSCGDITRVSIPQDYEGGLKGIAYMDFTDSNGVSKALELDGSQLGDGTLTVDEAKPRDNSFGSGGGRGRGRSDGGGRFSGGRGRFGGGGRSGGRFGGDSGGRFGGRGRSGGDRGGRGRGGFSGFLLGTRQTIMETKDGGNTWAPRSIPSAEDEDFNYRFNCISFHGKEGWIVGKPAILLHTSDGGDSWERIPLSAELPGDMVYIKATGDKSAEMVTDEGAIYITSNRGYNWKAAVQETVSATLNRTVSSGISGASYYTGTFNTVNRSPEGNYVAVSSRGNFYLTWEPGQPYWQPHNRSVARRIQNMGWRADGGLWLLVRGGGLYLSKGTGITEEFYEIPVQSRGFGILDVGYRSEDEAWAAGGSGVLLKTQNSGKTWTRDRAADNIAANLYSVKFINDKQGFVLGNDGVLLKYLG